MLSEAAVNGFVVAFSLSVTLLLTKNFHGRWSVDEGSGTQKSHSEPTPRVGGVAVFLSLLVSFSYANPDIRALLKPMIIGCLPAFFFGIAEDFSRRVEWHKRLLATLLSGLLICWLTGISVTSLGLSAVDAALSYALLSTVFTAFAVAGISNAFNIVDGLHGLCAGLALTALAAIGLIASAHNDQALVQVTIICAGVITGFLLVNFPFGKLFLGDGGAYLIGFFVAWVAVLLPYRNPAVSPWASLLVCFYPFCEVLISVTRRFLSRSSLTEPDRLHLHALFYRRVTRAMNPQGGETFRHAMVTVFIWIFASAGAGFAVANATNSSALMLACLAMSLCFIISQFLLSKPRALRL